MYLSKIQVSWSQARNPYDVHRALWRLFPDQENAERGFLFRVETERLGAGVELLVQSRWQPQHNSSESQLMATRPFSPKLISGQRLRFRLRANPIKAIKDEKGRKNTKGEVKTCRVPLVQEEQQLDWLNHKLSDSARLEAAQVTSIKPLYFRKNGRAGKLMLVTFDGVLQVDSPETFLLKMQTGIGPAKGFGCGLLSVAKA
jgi:CRISPR system Cascade subunit CasE